jgi:vacuolar-type H+-ATPase subunit E/Vma4
LQIKELDEFFIGGCKVENEKIGVIIDNTLKTKMATLDK